MGLKVSLILPMILIVILYNIAFTTTIQLTRNTPQGKVLRITYMFVYWNESFAALRLY